MTIDLSKIKLDLIVKNRKAELYLDEVRKDYYLPLIKDYGDCVRHVKNFIKIRKHPWYVHVYAQTMAFVINPMGYIKLKIQGYKFLVESYWGLKRLVKECEIEFDATEKSIEKSKKIINNIQKAIDDKVE